MPFSQNYKRAVLRLPPREFTVDVLSPTKQGQPIFNSLLFQTNLCPTSGNNFSYGLLICPVIRSKRSSDSRSTSSSDSGYEIWRRWEDCLDFQETLEHEYSKMSRQKVKVLKRGAKKQSDDRDCPYNLHQAAASFDSLPEGPDPREVVIDVHELIPPLTRKGTLFRASRSTLKQRADEFSAMIRALFNSSEDAPVLLQELRNCSPVRDFFGFWRRDKELVKKSGKDVSRSLHPNHSMSSLSTSFSLSTTPSSPASSAFPRTPISPVSLRHSMFTQLPQRGTTECSQDMTTPGSHPPASAPPASRRFEPDSPDTSQFSVSSYRVSQAGTDLSPGSMLFTDELLLQDDPNPDAQSIVRRRPLTHVSAPRSAPPYGSQMHHQVPRPSNIDASYPASEEVLPRPQPRPRSNSNAAPEYRNARIFFSTPNSPAEFVEHLPSEQIGPSHLTHGHAVSSLTSNINKQMSNLLSPISSQSSSHSASISSRPSNMSMNRFSVTSSVSSYARAPSKCSSSGHNSQYSCDFESYPDLGFAPPHSPIVFCTSLSEVAEAPDSDLGHRPRDSISSLASCRTEVSADGVLPPHLRIETRAPLPVDGSMSKSRDDLMATCFDGELTDPPPIPRVTTMLLRQIMLTAQSNQWRPRTRNCLTLMATARSTRPVRPALQALSSPASSQPPRETRLRSKLCTANLSSYSVQSVAYRSRPSDSGCNAGLRCANPLHWTTLLSLHTCRRGRAPLRGR